MHAAVLGTPFLGQVYQTVKSKSGTRVDFGFVEGSVDCPYGNIHVKLQRTKARGYRPEVKVDVSIMRL